MAERYRERLERARTRGMPREIVLAAVEAEGEHPAKRIGDVRCSLPLVRRGGCLDPQQDGPVITQLEHMFRMARCPLRASDGALWQAPEAAVGIATFPVAFDGLGGALRDVHVGFDRPPVSEGRVVAPRYFDERFMQAVEDAQTWALKHGRVHDPQALHDALLWVSPAGLVSRTFVQGGSVGLAAVVALVSWLSRRPVPAHLAFTGAICKDALTLKGIAEITQQAKLGALAQRPAVDTLYVPKEGWTQEMDGVDVRRRSNLQTVLDEVFSERWRPPVPPPPPQSTPVLLDLQHAVAALLLVAYRPLTHREIEAALPQAVWCPPLDLQGQRVHDILEHLAGGGSRFCELRAVKRADDTWTAVVEGEPKAPSQIVDHAKLHSAHQALSLALRNDPAAVAFHNILALDGSTDESQDTVGIALDPLLDGNPAHEAQALQVLRTVSQRGGTVPASLWSSASTRSPASLERIHLAHLCDELPEPMRSHAERLLGLSTAGERFLALQALVETLLHLLAGLLISASRRKAFKPAIHRNFRLFERPSIGLLKEVVERFGTTRALDADLPEVLGTLHALLRSQDSIRPDFAKLAEICNRVLHRAGAWEQLVGEHDGVHRANRELANILIGLLTSLGPAWRASFEPPSESGLYARCPSGDRLALGGLAIAVRDEKGAMGAAFYRGLIGPYVRLWDFAQGGVWRAEIEPVEDRKADPWSALHELRSLEAVPIDSMEVERPRIPLLPRPLAHCEVRLQEALKRDAVPNIVSAAALGVETHLGLVWFAIYPTEFPPEGAGAGPSKFWMRRITRRALLDRIIEWSAQPDRDPALLAYVHAALGPPPYADALALVGELERLEHHPGPYAALRPGALRAAAGLRKLMHRLVEVHERFEWVRGPSEAGQPVMRCMGMHDRTDDPRPGLSLPAREVAVRLDSNRLASLWPFACFIRLPDRSESGTVALLCEAVGPSKSGALPLVDFTPELMGVTHQQVKRISARWIDDASCVHPLETDIEGV